MSTTRNHEGWQLRESGPADAGCTVLLIAGAMCSGEFFEDVMSEPKLSSLHLFAATIPGFGGTTPPDDLSMESYARSAGKLAAELGCDVVGGHSLGANIALEMAASGAFSAPLVLLSPSFSREDEVKALAVLNAIGRVPGIGALAWRLMVMAMPASVKKSIPAGRRDALVADLANNDPRFCRRVVRRYYEYLDHHGSLVTRLCDTGVKSWVVFGERDEIGLKDDERAGLEACAVTMVTIPDATHFLLVEQPARTADVIADAVSTLDRH